MSYRYCHWYSEVWCKGGCYSDCGCDEMNIADQRDLIRDTWFVALHAPVEEVYPRGDKSQPASLNHLAFKTLIPLVDNFVANTHGECKVCPQRRWHSKVDHWHWHFRHWQWAYDTLISVYGFPSCIARYTVPKIPTSFKLSPDGHFIWNRTEWNHWNRTEWNHGEE